MALTHYTGMFLNYAKPGDFAVTEHQPHPGPTVRVKFTDGVEPDGRPFYTFTADDIGQPSIRAFGRSWLCSGFIGRVLPQDVGKRVYKAGSIVQVENDEQFRKRTGK